MFSSYSIIQSITEGNLGLRYSGETNSTLSGERAKTINTITTGRYDIFIEDLALQPNGRLRLDCPVCHKKNTLSVSDDGYQRMYNCFSANCDVKGVTGRRLTPTNSRSVFEKKSEPSVKHKVYCDFQLPTTFVPLSRNQKAIDYVRSVNSYQAYLDNRVDIMYDI